MIFHRFSDFYKRQAEHSGMAHGRVNLMGEHTDYNGGFVLPMSIPQKTQVQVAKRTDDKVCAVSVNLHEKGQCEYTLGQEQKRHDWIDYVQGVTSVLRAEGFKIGGFDTLIDSSVPMGSGLSSSAALEVALLKVLNHVFALSIDLVELAKIGQRAENEFVGAQVGIMDQMAASVGQLGKALFIDTRSMKYEHVALPADFSLLVVNSGVTHSHASGDYNRRRQECEEACKLLDVKQLRELSTADLRKLPRLPQTLAARARHVITENDRVTATLDALKNSDMEGLGQIFVQSHVSLRDDYQVSCREIDLLTELALAEPGVYGARLTGGGFGGSIIALTQKEKRNSIAQNIIQNYREKTGLHGTVLVPHQEGDLKP